MQWLGNAYGIALLATLALGVLLYLITGALYLVSGVADSVQELRIRRLRGPQRRVLGNTRVGIGDLEYQASQSQIRDVIESWGTWDPQRGVYVVELPESQRRSPGEDLDRCYVWAKPPYVWDALKASPIIAAAAALLLSFALGTVMWGGPHFGFAGGGLKQALWDKYGVTVAVEIPEDPAVNENFRDMTVRIDADRSRTGRDEVVAGCTIDAGGGIETLTVRCPDEFGEMQELHEIFTRPKEWF